MQVMDFSVPISMTTTELPVMLAGEGGIKIPGTELLGPFPILQFFAALIVLVVVAACGMVWIKGRTSVEPMSAPKNQEAAIQLFFDGPLKAIFDFLNEIRSKQTQNRMEIRDEVAEIVSDARQQITNEIDKAKSELRGDINAKATEVNQKLDNINGLLNRIDGKFGGSGRR